MEQVSGGTSNFSEEQKIFYTQGNCCKENFLHAQTAGETIILS